MAKLKFPFLFTLLVFLLIFCLTQSATVSADEVKWSRVNIPTQGNAGDWLLADGSDVQHLTMSTNGTLHASVSPIYTPKLVYINVVGTG